jgi:hypothetical protein
VSAVHPETGDDYFDHTAPAAGFGAVSPPILPFTV